MRKIKFILPIISIGTLTTTLAPALAGCSCSKKCTITLEAGEHGKVITSKIEIKKGSTLLDIKESLYDCLGSDDDYWVDHFEANGKTLTDSDTIKSNTTIKAIFGIEKETDSNSFTYSFSSTGNENTATVTSFIGSQTRIKIPEKVTRSGIDYTITDIDGLNNTNLKSINFNKATYIGYFEGMSNLTRICVSSENTVYKSQNNCITYSDGTTTKLIMGCVGSKIPDEVTKISDNAFDGSSITEIDLNNVTYICDAAFKNCAKLQTIDLKNVTKLEGNVFNGCTSLKEVNFKIVQQ